MAPKKVAAEVSTSNKEAVKEVKEDQRADGSEEVRKVSPHPSTMEMVKTALMELDQRKGVSAQAIRTFIKEKYVTVDETRLKTMVRKALIKGIDSGTFVRPANSSTMTGAQGRFRLAVRKPKPVKSKGAKENTNPNVGGAKEPKAKSGDAKTKKTKSAVEGDQPKKTKKNDALGSKVAPAKKPKAKRDAGAAEGDPDPKTQKNAKASKGESGAKSSAKKGKGVTRKAAESSEETSRLKKKKKKPEEGANEPEATVQKKGGKKAAQKVDEGGQDSSRSSVKKGKKAAGK